jgi:pyruvate carboxylase
MRDAHQSLVATRFRTHDLVKIAPATSFLGSGLFSLEMWGGATFDVAMRFLKEDPWERLDRLRWKIPNILFQMLLRGPMPSATATIRTTWCGVRRQGGGKRHRRLPGVRFPQLDQGHEVAMDAVRKSGAICEAAMCYTGDILDPKRDKYPLSYYVNLAKELERWAPISSPSRTWPACSSPLRRKSWSRR